MGKSDQPSNLIDRQRRPILADLFNGFTAIKATNNGFGQDARSANDGAARYLAGYPFDQVATCPIDFCAGIGAHHEFTIRSEFTGLWLKFYASSDAGWEASSPERARRNFVLPCAPENGACGPQFVDLTLYLPVSPSHSADNSLSGYIFFALSSSESREFCASTAVIILRLKLPT